MKDAMKTPGRTIGEALTLAARAHRVRNASLLAGIGLYPGQDQALQLLLQGDISMGDLATALRVKPPTASKMIARLAAQGLVTRGGIAGDARRVQAALTEEGHRRVAQLPGIAERLESELVAGLDRKERKRLRKMLRRAARDLAGGTAPAEEEETDEAGADGDAPTPSSGS